jgi:poly-gamma-glutamate synthesis protein (capsule biosynthesis protein)
MKRQKIFIYAGAIAIIAMGLFFVTILPGRTVRYHIDRPEISEPTHVIEKDEQPTKLIFVGDIMLSRYIGSLMFKNGDWRYPFLEIADYLKGADLTFGNLEGPMSARGVKVGSIYSFEDDPRSIEGLTYAGFDVLSVANNHIWDYGRLAFEDTMKTLEDHGMSHVGGGANFDTVHTSIIREVKGTKIAFLAYTSLLPPFLGTKEARPAVAFPDKDQMILDIQKARAMADIVIVSFHWGNEYATVHNSFQEELAHAAIDAGANMIVGHHPHVIEDIERYNDGYIAYSLGNFVFDQSFSDDTRHGLLLDVIVKDKKIASVTPHEVRFTDTYQPVMVQ